MLVDLGFRVDHWWRHTHEWRSVEYSKLEGLQAGFAISRFNGVLGQPLFRRPVSQMSPHPFGPRHPRYRGWTESTFVGRDYWVQAVADATGSVVVYAVTSCDSSFTPTFRAPYGAFSVKLRVSTFDDVVPWRKAQDLFAEAYDSGATGNNFILEFLSGGNPLDYKSFAWGVNDACGDWFAADGRSRYSPKLPSPTPGLLDYVGRTVRGGPAMMGFRKATTVNTYAEAAFTSGSFVDLPKSGFQIGVDRVLVRSVADQRP